MDIALATVQHVVVVVRSSSKYRVGEKETRKKHFGEEPLLLLLLQH